MIADIGLPLAVYYGLRAAGVDMYRALLASAVPPLLSAGVQYLRERRLDGMGAFVGGIVLISLGAAVIGGNPRFLLAKDGWTTAIAGIWYLLSVRARRPLVFHGARPLLEGRFRSDGTSWDVLWERARFRRIWRVSTVIWGVAMLVDAAVRVTMAYTLPVDEVPALGALLWPVTLGLLQVVNGVYYEFSGLWRITRGGTAASGTGTREPVRAPR
ncbi:hypothetical protein GXW82_35310 [Streptacidiphilus sp. 4-A2]|nr:hypothetical protein [Streptacidiphilus sp. 4-A2]